MEPLPAALKSATSRIAWCSDRGAHRFQWLASEATRKPKPSVAHWDSCFFSHHEPRHAPHAKLLADPAGVGRGLWSRVTDKKNGFSSACRRHVHRCPPDSISGSSGRSETLGEDATPQMNLEKALDLHQAKEELLASLESVRKSADGGSVYLLQSRLSKALPESSAAASISADVGRLVSELNELKQEKAALMAFRHQSPREIRKEYTQMMLIGLATGLAAAIHPIFFAGTICGVLGMRRARMAEADRDAGTSRLEEVIRLVKQNKADLDVLLDKLALLVKDPRST